MSWGAIIGLASGVVGLAYLVIKWLYEKWKQGDNVDKMKNQAAKRNEEIRSDLQSIEERDVNEIKDDFDRLLMRHGILDRMPKTKEKK